MFKTCPNCNGIIKLKYEKIINFYSLFKCENCDIEIINPQPGLEVLKNIYTENYYESWGIVGNNENHIIKNMKQQTFDLRLKQIMNFKNNGKILDVGCATGFFLEKAMEYGFEPYGIELSEFSSNIAKKKFGENNVFNGTIEDSKFEENYFDVICMSDLLEHVIDPISVIQKSKKLLKKDGIIMIMSPDTNSFSAKIMGKNWTQYKLEHLFYFNDKSINIIIGEDFKIIQSIVAKKVLNLEYIYTQFNVYKNKLITPILNLLKKILPKSLFSKNFKISIGEKVWIIGNK